MPRAPVADRLRHMLDAVARIETLTAGKSFEDYVGGSRSAKRFLTPFPNEKVPDTFSEKVPDTFSAA